jgi:ElaB/YqjD/DUF883 family membrane-anchored ribosome-binding protein
MNKSGTTDAGAGVDENDINERDINERIDALKDTVKGLVDQGAHKVDEIKTKVVEVKDQAFTRGSALLDRVTVMVRAHPMKAVGIAFGAGYLVMRLVRR